MSRLEQLRNLLHPNLQHEYDRVYGLARVCEKRPKRIDKLFLEVWEGKLGLLLNEYGAYIDKCVQERITIFVNRTYSDIDDRYQRVVLFTSLLTHFETNPTLPTSDHIDKINGIIHMNEYSKDTRELCRFFNQLDNALGLNVPQ